jgi:hypothetical protein
MKQQVSQYKFKRVVSSGVPCRAYRYQPREYEPEASVEAYVFGNHCYAVFLVNRGQDKLERVYLRYWVGDNERADTFAYLCGYESF